MFFIILLPSLGYSQPKFSGYINIFEQKKQVIQKIENYDDNALEENGWLFLSLYMYEDAEKIFKKLLQKKEETIYYIGLGYALRGQGKTDESIKAFRKAYKELDYIEDEKIFKVIDDNEKRKNIEIYEELIRRQEKKEINLASAKKLMEVSSYLGDWKSSIKYAEKALNLENEYLTKLRLAIFSYRAGKYQSAERHLTDLNVEYPDDPYILSLLSVTSVKNYDSKKAKYYFEKALNFETQENIESLIKNFTGEKIKDINEFFKIQIGDLRLFLNYYNNSSEVTRKSFGEQINIRDKSSTYRIGHQRDYFYKDDRDSILRDDLNIEYKNIINNDWIITSGISAMFYNNDKSIVPFHLSIGKAIERFYLSISYDSIPISDIEKPDDNLLYNYASDFPAVKKIIRTEDKSLFVKYEDDRNVSFVKFVYGDYSDENTKKSLVFDSSLKLLSNKELRVGYTYFYLDYKNPAEVFIGNNFSEKSYYDPTNFEVHSVYIKGENKYKFLDLNFEFRLGYIPKSDGIGRTINLGANIPVYKNHSFGLVLRNYHHNKGVGRSGLEGRFWANQIFFGYKYRF